MTPVLCAITKSSGHYTRILNNARRNAAFGDECVFEVCRSLLRPIRAISAKLERSIQPRRLSGGKANDTRIFEGMNVLAAFKVIRNTRGLPRSAALVFEEMPAVGGIADLVRATGPILGTPLWDN